MEERELPNEGDEIERDEVPTDEQLDVEAPNESAPGHNPEPDDDDPPSAA